MAHLIEKAASGRAKCRGCDQRIAAGEMRFGERLPNPFAEKDGELMTHWFHLACAAFTRPEAFLETSGISDTPIDDKDALEREARLGVAHRRLPRVRAVQRASSGRAACRACREPIAKDTWRIALAFYEDGRFVPSGYIHAGCAAAYLETTDVLARLRHFSPGLTDADFADIRAALAV
jgi:hypothetical protein